MSTLHVYDAPERISRELLKARLPRAMRPLIDRTAIRYPIPPWFLDPERFIKIGGRYWPIIAGGAANTSPLFALTPNIGFATISAANTATDGTGTVSTIFTAGANGSRVDRIRCVPLGTNTASKVYLFVNNGGAQGTATNNALAFDIVLAASTASNTALIGAPVEIAVNIALKSSYVLNATLATAVATGWKIIAMGGDW